jgi:hypothetical protein
MAKCKLWVQNNAYHTTVRADRIIALRVTVQPATGEDPHTPFHLEAVTADTVGETGGTAVRLCSGQMEDFPAAAPRELARLIARYIDNRVGGVIECADEEIAKDLSEGMFYYHSFSKSAESGCPGSEEPARPPRR